MSDLAAAVPPRGMGLPLRGVLLLLLLSERRPSEALCSRSDCEAFFWMLSGDVGGIDAARGDAASGDDADFDGEEERGCAFRCCCPAGGGRPRSHFAVKERPVLMATLVFSWALARYGWEGEEI